MKALFRLNHYLLKYWLRLLLGTVFIVLSNLYAVVPAKVIRIAFDHIAAPGTVRLDVLGRDLLAGLDMPMALLMLGGVIVASALLKGVFMFFMRQTIVIMSRLIEFDQKNEIYSHYQRLSAAFFKRNSTGDLMARITEDVSRVRMYLGPAIMYTVNLVVLFVLVIWNMLEVSVPLTLYVLLPLPLLSILIYVVSARINQRSEEVQRQLSALSTFVQEAFSGIRVLKAYAKEDEWTSEFGRETDGFRHVSMRLVRTNAFFAPAMIMLIGLSTLLTVYVGGNEAIAGRISAGNIAEFIIYINMLTWPVAALGWVTSIVQRAAASQQRINEFLDSVPDIINPTKEPLRVVGDVRFEHVSLVYPDSGIRALNDVSFHVAAGTSLAILGRTGSGKSTIAALLARVYDATSGRVLIDGRDIRTINLDDLRRQTGVVPQEVFLFSDTIGNNIAFGVAGGAEQERIELAATRADIHDSIVSFPEGYATRVGERGITLSGGQKQRISIARAIIKEPSILVFDDCLSAVDTETEDTILGHLRQLMAGRTTVIISHRVSSVRNADQIIVLDEGRIIEQGNHTTLLAAEGAYHALYQKQLLEDSAS
jgi:ATP-binding cassette subfamily B protein